MKQTDLLKDDDSLFYILALKSVKNIGSVKAKYILNNVNTPKEVFKLSQQNLISQLKLNVNDATNIKSFKDFSLIEKEINFIRKNKITPILFSDDDYPHNLKHFNELPFLLFTMGNKLKQKKKVISIVGTRNYSAYGKQITIETVNELTHLNPIIVSGLAEGIDTVAHQSALENGLSTIAFLGHGLSTIFPSSNKGLAKNILDAGGTLVTEFLSYVYPSKETFPIRNKTVAAICDALIIIETKKKGGSMITANCANEYNKEVFAVPGRVGDEKSEGCNYLIQTHRATILHNVKDVVKLMGWDSITNNKNTIRSLELPLGLNENQKIILNILQNTNDKVHLDMLITDSKIPYSKLSEELLILELAGHIKSLPGKYFGL